MRFIVTLRNQSTGITRTVEISSSYDAAAVLSRTAKATMNLPAAWDYVSSRRIEPLEDRAKPANHIEPGHSTPAGPNEHYARTDSGELIGPYDTAEECEQERAASNAEKRLALFVAGYIRCALWSSTDQSRENGGDPLDQNYNGDDVSAESRAQITAECSAFLRDNAADIDAYCAEESVIEMADDSPVSMAGHDLWLTRNHHGAGFWDRGTGAIGKRLTDAAHALGECELYIGDDKSLYLWPSNDRMVVIGQAEGIDQHGIMYLDDGPGKFERVPATDRKLAAALYILANNGDYDEQCGDADERGCATRVDRFVMIEDVAGFVEVVVYEDADNASDYAQSFEIDDDANKLTESEAESRFDEHLFEAYGNVEVCGMTMEAGKVLKECDNIAYREAFNNWTDAEGIEII